MTTGLVARILCSHCHGLTSVSGWEPKPCFKLLQTEVTQDQWDFNTIMQLIFIRALQPVLGDICTGHRTELAHQRDRHLCDRCAAAREKYEVCEKTGAWALEILHFCPKSVQKAKNWYPSKKNATDRYKATEVIRQGSLGLQLCSLEFSKNPQVSDREIFPKVWRANLGRDIFPIIYSRIVSNDHPVHWSYEQSMENVRWTHTTRLEDKIQR